MAKTPNEALDEYFFKELKNARSNPDAYDKASKLFEQQHNLAPPITYDAMRMRHARNKKARR